MGSSGYLSYRLQSDEVNLLTRRRVCRYVPQKGTNISRDVRDSDSKVESMVWMGVGGAKQINLGKKGFEIL